MILSGHRNGDLFSFKSNGDINSCRIEEEKRSTISSIDTFNNYIITGHWDGSFRVRQMTDL